MLTLILVYNVWGVNGAFTSILPFSRLVNTKCVYVEEDLISQVSNPFLLPTIGVLVGFKTFLLPYDRMMVFSCESDT